MHHRSQRPFRLKLRGYYLLFMEPGAGPTSIRLEFAWTVLLLPPKCLLGYAQQKYPKSHCSCDRHR
jgi:hypothetical protein